MAKEFIEIGAKTDQAQKAVKGLTDDVSKLNEEVNKTGDGGLSGVGSSAGKSSKGVAGLSSAFSALGTAIKATGIGALVALLVSLGDALTRNQRVADFFSRVMNTVTIVMDDFISLLVDNFSNVTSFFKDVFENPVENIKKLGEAIKNNIIERFNSLLDTLGHLGTAFKKLFEGDFSGALDSVGDASKEFVDVMTGVNNSVDKISETVEKGIDAISKYGEEVSKSADRLTQLKKNAQIAAAQQELLNKQYLREAEIQRQIRDDVSKPIEERIEANQKLSAILEKQEQVMLKAANAQLALASFQNQLNSNTENYVALLEAQTNQADVLESVNGFKSEQLVNQVGLQQELLDLEKAKGEAEQQLAFQSKQFNAERIADTEQRITRQLELLDEQRTAELERLQAQIDQYREGTQLRLDAEIEYNTRKQELDQAQIEYEDELAEFRAEREKAESERRLKSIQDEEAKKQQAREQTFENLATLTGQEEALGRANLIFKQLMAAKEQLITLGVLKSKASAVVAESSLDAAGATKDIAKGTSATAKLGFPQAIPALIAFAATAAGIISAVTGAVSKTKSVAKSIGGSGPSGGGGSASIPAPPQSSFNIVGAPSAGNQIAEAIAEQSNQPIQAYVAVNDINDAQGLEDNIVNSATISG